MYCRHTVTILMQERVMRLDNKKTGALIRALRTERGLTQRQLADGLGVSDKAVSKWECGLGAPEHDLLVELSTLLGIGANTLLTGELDENERVCSNMKNAVYFICPTCGSISVSIGNAQVSCCGRTLAALTAQKPDEAHSLSIETVEDEWYVTSDHPMTKEHYISLVAFATGDRIQLIKQYPEWNLSLRIARRGHGTLLWYCTEHGLFRRLL